jgi:hypothetical protein
VLAVFGGNAGIIAYYITGPGFSLDMSLKSFLVQSHPLVQAEQGVFGALPWCAKADSCYHNKCGAFFDRNLHSRLPLDPTHVRFEANMRVTNGIPLGWGHSSYRLTR